MRTTEKKVALILDKLITMTIEEVEEQIFFFLTISQKCPCFCMSALQKTLLEKEKLLITSNFSFSQVFSTLLEDSLPYSLSSAKFFSLKIF